MDNRPESQKKILIVDDQVEIARIINDIMKKEGYETAVAHDGEEALARFKEFSPDLVILDIDLPKIDGITVCKTIKQTSEFVPVIIITGKMVGIKDKVKGIEGGADDYLTKPFDIAELIARSRAMFRLKDMYEALKAANARFEELSLSDPLTGIYNRRYLIDRIEAEIKRAVRVGNEVSCMIVDVDGFKPLNDTYGHSFGDIVLKELAMLLKINTRQTDVLARYGGDEFMVLTPDTDKKGAAILAEKLIAKVNEAAFKHGDRGIKLAISIGISSFSGKSVGSKIIDSNSLKVLKEALINGADSALYEAKKRGKGRAFTL